MVCLVIWSVWSTKNRQWVVGEISLFGHLVYLVCLVIWSVWSIWSSGLFGLSSHLVYRNRQGAMGKNGLSGPFSHLVIWSNKTRKARKTEKPESAGGRARIIKNLEVISSLSRHEVILSGRVPERYWKQNRCAGSGPRGR
jgi:hypothetical protein